MYPPTNFRKINTPNLKFNIADNRENNCVNCFYYKQVDHVLKVGKVGDCSYYNYPDEIPDDIVVMKQIDNPRNSNCSETTCDYFFKNYKISDVIEPQIKSKIGKTFLISFIASFAVGTLIANTVLYFKDNHGLSINDDVMRTIVLALIGVFTIGITLLRCLKYNTIIKEGKKIKTEAIEHRDSEIRLKQAELKEHIQKVKERLSKQHKIPFQSVYSEYGFNEEDLYSALKDFPYPIFKVTDSEIVVDNHYRIQFLDLFCDYCESIKKEKEAKILDAELEKKILKKAGIYCEKCGSEVLEKQHFCPECGSQITISNRQK